MPTKRKNLVELAESGTLGRHLGRYQNRIAHAEAQPDSVGRAPAVLSIEEKSIWAELVKNAPPGLLQKSDRAILEVACRVMSRVRNPRLGTVGADLRLLANLLGKLGLTPTERRKVDIPPTPRKKTQIEINEDEDWDGL